MFTVLPLPSCLIATCVWPDEIAKSLKQKQWLAVIRNEFSAVFKTLQCFNHCHNTLTEVALFLAMHWEQIWPVSISYSACKSINTGAKFSHSEVKRLVQGSAVGNGERQARLQRVELVHRLVCKAAGMDCRCCFQSPLMKIGSWGTLAWFHLVTFKQKKKRKIKPPTPKPRIYCTLRDIIHYIK